MIKRLPILLLPMLLTVSLLPRSYSTWSFGLVATLITLALLTYLLGKLLGHLSLKSDPDLFNFFDMFTGIAFLLSFEPLQNLLRKLKLSQDVDFMMFIIIAYFFPSGYITGKLKKKIIDEN